MGFGAKESHPPGARSERKLRPTAGPSHERETKIESSSPRRASPSLRIWLKNNVRRQIPRAQGVFAGSPPRRRPLPPKPKTRANSALTLSFPPTQPRPSPGTVKGRKAGEGGPKPHLKPKIRRRDLLHGTKQSTAMPDATSVIAPVLAIVLAIVGRQVHLALLIGIWVGAAQLSEGQVFTGLAKAIEICVGTLADPGNAKVVLFSAMVGAVIALTQHSGGVQGFVALLTDRGWVNNRRRAMLLSWCIGILIFVESSLTSLINGAICRPLFDRYRISREKLAYLCDATAAPACMLIPLNGWAAFVVGLLQNEKVDNPLQLFLQSIPYNFYAIIALLLALFIAYSGRDFAAMRRAEDKVNKTPTGPETTSNSGSEPGSETASSSRSKPGAETDPETTSEPGSRSGNTQSAPPPSPTPTGETIAPGPALDFILPIAVMIAMMPLGLWVTGEGDLLKGSGSTSVLWAVLAACAVSSALLMLRGRARLHECIDIAFRGIGELVSLSALLMLAFAIGQITRELGTGVYLSHFVSDWIALPMIPAAIFVVTSLTAFATGTSWGTFALMIPIALPLVGDQAALLPLAIAAVLGGGVFGDHCSPISDTTLISSLAAGCDHIDHVNTQLPYALLGGAVAIAAFIIGGFALS